VRADASATEDPVLIATGLTKHFPVHRTGRSLLTRVPRKVHAVDDVDLVLRRGRATALVGESGAGKSTVARLLAGLQPRTAGEIRLHGQPVSARRGRRIRAYRGRVQLIFQDPFASLNPMHTVRYHLGRTLRLHRKVNQGPELDAAIHELLAEVTLVPQEWYLDKFPHELSGGQRQRVAIARALGARPEVLLADEPVSMLDASIRLGVLNLLADLKQRTRLAFLYITHDIASARYFAEEILVMYAGRVVEGGDTETVTQRPAHPYTQLLIESAPEPGRSVGEPGGARAAITEPPDLMTPPAGCRFHPRCPHAMRRCQTHVPPRIELSDAPGHWTACWLHAPEPPVNSR
jgi:peptide/nickel transport system ATP-binding protein